MGKTQALGYRGTKSNKICIEVPSNLSVSLNLQGLH